MKTEILNDIKKTEVEDPVDDQDGAAGRKKRDMPRPSGVDRILIAKAQSNAEQ